MGLHAKLDTFKANFERKVNSAEVVNNFHTITAELIATGHRTRWPGNFRS
jgi:hypothetical protein